MQGATNQGGYAVTAIEGACLPCSPRKNLFDTGLPDL